MSNRRTRRGAAPLGGAGNLVVAGACPMKGTGAKQARHSRPGSALFTGLVRLNVAEPLMWV